MRKLILSLITLLILSSALISADFQDEPLDIVGIYEIKGDLDDDTYSGIAIIKRTEEEDYLIGQWTAGIGSNATGFIAQDKTRFYAVWNLKGVNGLTIYTRGEGRNLIGKWTDMSGKWHNETLTYLKAWPKKGLKA